MAMDFLVSSLCIAVMTDLTDFDAVEEILSQLLVLEEYQFIEGFQQ
jgi:hypothetical protein